MSPGSRVTRIHACVHLCPAEPICSCEDPPALLKIVRGLYSPQRQTCNNFIKTLIPEKELEIKITTPHKLIKVPPAIKDNSLLAS